VQYIWLQLWLLVVALMRLFSVFTGYLNVELFRVNLFPEAVDSEVSKLQGRTFGVWVCVTCVLCVLCACYIKEPAIFLATLLSFVIALVFFALEFLVYETMSPASIMSPFVVASISIIWMSYHYIYKMNSSAVHVKKD